MQLLNGNSVILTHILTQADIDNGYALLTTSSLADGTAHLIATISIGATANVSLAAPDFAVTIDTVAPVVPTGIDLAAADDSGGSNSDNLTNQTSGLTISGTAETGSTVQLFDDIDNDGVLDAGELLASGTAAAFATGIDIALAEVVHHVKSIATDVAGNAGPAGSGLDITVDATPPTQTVRIYSFLDNVAPDTGQFVTGSRTNDATPVFTGGLSAGLAPGETLRIYDGTTLLSGSITVYANDRVSPSGTIDPPYYWEFTPAILAEGSHSFTARVVDAAGNEGTASTAFTLTVDTTAPASTLAITELWDVRGSLICSDSTGWALSSLNGMNELCGTYSGTLASGDQIQVSFDGGANWLDVIYQGDNRWYYYGDMGVHNSSFTFQARIVDAAGNAGPVDRQDLTIGTTPPAAPTGLDLAAADDNGVSSTDNITSATTGLTISGTAEAGSTVRLFDDTNNNGVLDTGEVLATGIDIDIALTEGVHHIKAIATDTVGNAGVASSVLDIIIDTTAPAQTATIATYTDNAGIRQGNYATGTPTDDTTPVLNGTLSAAIGATDAVRIYDGATYLGNATVSGTTWTYAPATLASGSSHSYTARVTDAAVDQGAASTALSLTVDATPPPNVLNIAEIWEYNYGGYTLLGSENTDWSADWHYENPFLVVGTYTGTIAAGDKIQITFNNGATWLDVTNIDPYGVGTWEIANFGYNHNGGFTYTVRMVDAVGNIGNINSQQVACTSTPLVLDLNGDGVHTVDATHGVLFDVDNNGALNRSGWVDSSDGLLVRDLNHNGAIDDGGELFGSGTLLANGN